MWVLSVDKSKGSKSAEFRRIWEIYDERLGWISTDDVCSIDAALISGDLSGAWVAAERALVDAFCLAGVPILERGFCLGRDLARFNRVRLGGPKVRGARARCSDPGDGAMFCSAC